MRAWVLLLVLGCRDDEPVTPVPTELCAPEELGGQEFDCRQLDPCAVDPTMQYACCACDAALCELTCDPLDLPPDTAPIVDFDRPLWADVASTFGESVRVTFTPDQVLVGDDPALAVQASCTRDRNTFTCDSIQVADGIGRTLVLDTLQVRVSDFDQDGDLDSGLLRAVGTLQGIFQGTGAVGTLAPMMEDVIGEDAELPQGALPGAPLFVRLGELGAPGPVPTLRVDGVARPLEEVVGVGGILGYVQPAGAPLLPWGAELALDGELFDLAGNPVLHGVAQVAPDPGLWTDNPSFEIGGRWIALGFQYGFEYWDPTVPYDGDALAYTWSAGTLVGHAPIPVDATTLSFAIRSDGPAPVFATLTGIGPDGARTTLWELGSTPQPECEPPYWGTCLPWTVPTVDLAPWAGEDLILELVVGSDWGLAAVPAEAPDVAEGSQIYVDAFSLD